MQAQTQTVSSAGQNIDNISSSRNIIDYEELAYYMARGRRMRSQMAWHLAARVKARAKSSLRYLIGDK